MFTIRDLKPRGPRGFFKIMKAARIYTKANLKEKFIVWEPLPCGKVKVSLSLIVQGNPSGLGPEIELF